MLAEALGTVRFDRVLDVGCGSGRFLPVFGAQATEYVGIDVQSGVINVARGKAGTMHGLAFAKADARILPFRDASFSAVTMIRVYHRLESPSDVLREIARVLKPGGTLIITVTPNPSVATLVRDIWTRLSNPYEISLSTFSRKSRISLTSGTNPAFVETIRLTRSRLTDLHFHIIRELGCGYEELPAFRGLPANLWIRIGKSLKASPLFPCVFVIARRPVGE